MRVVGMRCVYLSAPVSTPVQTSFSQMQERPVVLVLLEDEDGHVGVGESWCNFPSWAPRERLVTLEHGVGPLLKRLEFDAPPEFTAELIRSLEPMARQSGAIGLLYQAVSAVDIALWDLKGQERGVPVSRLLAEEPRTKLPVYASGLGPPDPVALARDLYERGVRMLKLKVGFGFDEDRSNLQRLQEAYGDARIAVDANQAWRTAEAVEFSELLEETDCVWVEEPTAAERLDVLRNLRERFPCPLAGGENYYSMESFRDVWRAGALDIIQPDVTKSGGITQASAVMKAARAQGLESVPHFLGGAVGFVATLHCYAATSGRLPVEMDSNPNPLFSKLLIDPITVECGAVGVPDGPGLGITIDQEVLREHLRVEVEC